MSFIVARPSYFFPQLSYKVKCIRLLTSPELDYHFVYKFCNVLSTQKIAMNCLIARYEMTQVPFTIHTVSSMAKHAGAILSRMQMRQIPVIAFPVTCTSHSIS